MVKEKVNVFIGHARQRIAKDPSLREQPTNFLEALLVEQEKTGKFSEEEVYGNVLTMLMAGEDTTSFSTSWAIYHLAQHPAIVKKIRAEAYAVYGASAYPTSISEVGKLRFTEAVALEVFRIKPVAPLLVHEALQDVVVGGIMVKKGTMAIGNVEVGHHDEKHFGNPHMFSPERWLPAGCPAHGNHDPRAAMAFGAGARYCPGAYLATLQITVAISMVCKNFDISLAVAPETVTERSLFAISPENLWVNLKPLAVPAQ